jgi:hypothetical protein
VAISAGNTSALPAGMSITDLVDVIGRINNNFDNGQQNTGYLQ